MDKIKLMTMTISAATGIALGVLGTSIASHMALSQMSTKDEIYPEHDSSINMGKDGHMGAVCAPKNGILTAMEGTTSTLSTKSGKGFDKAFITEMTLHHEGAIQMAKQALEKSTRPEIKAMSKEIISAQTKEIEQMKSWK